MKESHARLTNFVQLFAEDLECWAEEESKNGKITENHSHLV
jgi:hypothetical protein